MNRPRLITFTGLPGTGKSTLARELALVIEAIYLRVDSVEDGLKASALKPKDVMDAGYCALWAIAADNLDLGLEVVGDSVNPLVITRNGWRHVAHMTGALMCSVEVVCSDRAEHRDRVENRRAAQGKGPTWADVEARIFEPMTTPRLSLDTAGRTSADALAELLDRLPPRP
ncbi:MAG: AAA family ATPase [Pseudomonadota bacterium]